MQNGERSALLSSWSVESGICSDFPFSCARAGRLSLGRKRGRVRVDPAQFPGAVAAPHLHPLPFLKATGGQRQIDCRANLASFSKPGTDTCYVWTFGAENTAVFRIC
jgi:hypothetical protein